MRSFIAICSTIFILVACSSDETDPNQDSTPATQIEQETANNVESNNVNNKTTDSSEDPANTTETSTLPSVEEEIGDLAIPDEVSEEAKTEESKAVIDTEDVIPPTDSVAEVSPSTKSSNDQSSNISTFIYYFGFIFSNTISLSYQ